jgi:hypothetical protein
MSAVREPGALRAEIEHARWCAVRAREWAAELFVDGDDERAASLIASAREHADRAIRLSEDLTGDETEERAA